MIIKPNLYYGERRIIANPENMVMARYIGDLTNLTEGNTYTFSCKMKQVPGEGREFTNIVHVVQGHNKRYKSYGNYVVKDISNGILEFTFNYIAEANSILCYTDLSQRTINMGAEWSEIEIVEGDTKNPVYIPNENTIDLSKQAVFKAGGGIPRGVSTLLRLGVGYVS